jgi:hypothetical protein
MEQAKFLEDGAALLAPLLEPLGYVFTIAERLAYGSGGDFATAVYRWTDREIRLWARYENLSTRYALSGYEFTHDDLMRATGLDKSAQFPGFNNGEPMSAFRRLRHDLQDCDAFLTGDASMLIAHIQALPPKATGFKALGL